MSGVAPATSLCVSEHGHGSHADPALLRVPCSRAAGDFGPSHRSRDGLQSPRLLYASNLAIIDRGGAVDETSEAIFVRDAARSTTEPVVVGGPGPPRRRLPGTRSRSAAGQEPLAGTGKAAGAQPDEPALLVPRAYQEVWKGWGCGSRPAATTLSRFATATGCTKHLTKTGACRWDSPGRRGCWDSGQGLGNDCLLCHAGRVAGRTIIGLGNTSLDMQSLYEELAAADGIDPADAFTPVQRPGHERGLEFRGLPDAVPRLRAGPSLPGEVPALQEPVRGHPGLVAHRRKRTIYHLGLADSRSVRTLMPFLLIPGNSAESIKRREADFADIRAFLQSSGRSQVSFRHRSGTGQPGQGDLRRTCRRCHGGPAQATPTRTSWSS